MKENNTNSGHAPVGGCVLAPIDFSLHSEAALAWALQASARMGAPLVILHVIHDPEGGPGYYARPKRKGFLRRMEEAAREMMNEFLEDFRGRHAGTSGLDDADVEFVVGLPATRILEVADDLGAQLIVMGSQGRTGLERFLLGSKAQRVAQLARVPVTIVKSEIVE